MLLTVTGIMAVATLICGLYGLVKEHSIAAAGVVIAGVTLLLIVAGAR